MKREIERELRLPAFELNMGELELLWQKTIALFDPSQPIRASINLSLPNEKIEFDSIDELKSYSELRGRVVNFSIHTSQGKRSISLKTGGLFNAIPTLKINSDSDVWCAGANESIFSVISRNKVWYAWFIYAPFNTIFMVLALAPWFARQFSGKDLQPPLAVALIWFGAIVTFGFIGFFREKLLPAATITFSNEIGFIRRYGSELGLLLGILSIAIAFYMWLNSIAP